MSWKDETRYPIAGWTKCRRHVPTKEASVHEVTFYLLSWFMHRYTLHYMAPSYRYFIPYTHSFTFFIQTSLLYKLPTTNRLQATELQKLLTTDNIIKQRADRCHHHFDNYLLKSMIPLNNRSCIFLCAPITIYHRLLLYHINPYHSDIKYLKYPSELLFPLTSHFLNQ